MCAEQMPAIEFVVCLTAWASLFGDKSSGCESTCDQASVAALNHCRTETTLAHGV